VLRASRHFIDSQGANGVARAPDSAFAMRLQSFAAVSSGGADRAMASHACDAAVYGPAVSRDGRNMRPHMRDRRISSRQARRLIAASLDPDFIWRPARRAASVGFKIRRAGTRWRHGRRDRVEACDGSGALRVCYRAVEPSYRGGLGPQRIGGGGRGAQGSDSAGDSAVSGAGLGWRTRIRGRRAHLARARRIFVLPLPGRRFSLLTVCKTMEILNRPNATRRPGQPLQRVIFVQHLSENRALDAVRSVVLDCLSGAFQ
jgi:hypothetical protein